jgi:hypothetical protein
VEQDELGERPAVVGPVVRAADPQVAEILIWVTVLVSNAFARIGGPGRDLAERRVLLTELTG